jgi:hypothetical protein
VRGVSNINAIPVPGGARRMSFEDSWNAGELVVELPKRVLAGRNMLRIFKNLYVERG